MLGQMRESNKKLEVGWRRVKNAKGIRVAAGRLTSKEARVENKFNSLINAFVFFVGMKIFFFPKTFLGTQYIDADESSVLQTFMIWLLSRKTFNMYPPMYVYF